MSTDANGSGTAGLYRLLAWSSPAFPIGAFSYSHGLEAAVASGAIRDRRSLQQWVVAIVLRGSGRIDADILRDAYRAAQAGDEDAVAEANRRGLAYRGTAELALESGQQGEAFLAAFRDAWVEHRPQNPSPPFRAERVPEGDSPRAGEVGLDRRSGIPHLTPTLSAAQSTMAGGEGVHVGAGESISHPAAFGAAAAQAGVALEDALLAYLQGFAANLVSAGIRLGIVGQTDGQRILAALETDIVAAATEATTRGPEAFGAATFAADLASMAHETQYSRLFRS